MMLTIKMITDDFSSKRTLKQVIKKVFFLLLLIILNEIISV